jgi:hypothetical protein
MVVQPETVLRWHRQWLRRRWAQRSRSNRPAAPEGGRPHCSWRSRDTVRSETSKVGTVKKSIETRLAA